MPKTELSHGMSMSQNCDMECRTVRNLTEDSDIPRSHSQQRYTNRPEHSKREQTPARVWNNWHSHGRKHMRHISVHRPFVWLGNMGDLRATTPLRYHSAHNDRETSSKYQKKGLARPLLPATSATRLLITRLLTMVSKSLLTEDRRLMGL